MSLQSRISDLVVAIREKLNTITPRLLPLGGVAGQVLAKKTNTDYDTEWADFGGWAPIEFFGTGSPQNITLPETCTSDDVVVFVEGIFQHAGWSITENVLTTTQPLNYRGIIVRYGAGLRGDAGSEVTVSSVVGLTAALAAKADAIHEHAIDDIVGLSAELSDLATAINEAGNQTYEWQSPASTTSWNISHNLGRYPTVTTVDSGGTQFLGTITYIDINTLRVDFAFATGGTAYLV